MIDHRLNKRPLKKPWKSPDYFWKLLEPTLETSSNIPADSSHYILAVPAAIATICKLYTTNCCLNKQLQATSTTDQAPMALTPFGFPSVFNGEACCPQVAPPAPAALKLLRMSEASALA